MGSFLFSPRITRILRLLQVLEQHIEALKACFPKLPIAFGPFGDFLDGVRFEGAKVLAAFPMAFDQAGGFEIGEVFGNGLLGNVEGSGELVDRGRTDGEAMEDGAACGVGESGESEVQRIHNQMVVYLRLAVKQLF